MPHRSQTSLVYYLPMGRLLPAEAARAVSALEVFMEISDLADEVIACKNKTITDEVFLLIQNNRDLCKCGA